MDTFISDLTHARPALLRTARSRLRNTDWAEDAVSETVLAALQRRPDFTEPGRVRAWLFGVLRHKVADQIRMHLGTLGELTQIDPSGDELDEIGDSCAFQDPMHHMADRQFMRALQGQLERLPRAHADAFMMRECLGTETTEICDTLAISPGNLSVILHRTRNRLRQSLHQHRS